MQGGGGGTTGGRIGDLPGLVALVVRSVTLLVIAYLSGAGNRMLLHILEGIERAVWAVVLRRADRMVPELAGLAGDSRALRRACTPALPCPDGSAAWERRINRIRTVMVDPQGCAARVIAYRRRMRDLGVLPPGSDAPASGEAGRAHAQVRTVPLAPDTS